MAAGVTLEQDICESETTFDYFCQPCGGQRFLEAVGLCLDCGEWLCDRCFRCHTLPTPLRHHVMKTVKQMENSSSDVHLTDKCYEICIQHDGEVVQYFCEDDNQLSCGECIQQFHRSCKKVLYIPHASNNFQSSLEYRDLERRLKNLQSESLRLIKQTGKKNEFVEECHKNALEAVDKYREELNKVLDRIEDNIKAHIEKLKAEETKRIEIFEGRCEHLKAEVESYMGKIDMMKKQKQLCSIYAVTKRATQELPLLEDRLKETKTESQRRRYWFDPNLNLLSKPHEMGQICEEMAKICAKPVKDINVRSPDDKNCRITDSTILSDKSLVLADLKNDKLKLVDLGQQKMIAELKLPSYPWSVACVGDDKVAVTLPNIEAILFAKADQAFHVDKQIQVRGACRGMASCGDKLVVSFVDNFPDRVEVLDHDGVVLHQFISNEQGEPLFFRPLHVAVARYHRTVYISNNGNHTIVTMQTDGSKKAIHTTKDLKGPGQVATDNEERVYVCCALSNAIHAFLPEMNESQVILIATDRVEKPNCVSHCDQNGTLYIGMNKSDAIKVYQLC